MNALANLKNLPFTKLEQQDFTAQAVEEILSGNIDPLQADIRLKAMADTIEAIRKNDKVKSYTVEEAEKNGKKFILYGAEITVTQKTTKDFTGLDPTLDGLYLALEQTKAQIKAREATVGAGCDPATGETFMPPKTSTTQYLTYKFK